MMDNRVYLTAALYLPTVNQTYNDNAGDAHTAGIEVDLVARVTDRFRMRLGGDYNEAET